MTKPLTKDEQKWIDAIENLLLNCPERFGFYTIGDPSLSIYDRTKEKAIYKLMDGPKGGDFCICADSCKANLGSIKFPTNIHSTAG